MTVAVVTDSTSSLTAEDISGLRVQIVGLRVRVADQVNQANQADQTDRSDGDTAEQADHGAAELSGAEVSAVLSAGTPISTSRPTQHDFTGAFERALQSADSVVSIHLSSRLSGTCDAARVAAGPFGTRVLVIDSRTTAMGLGFAVLRAARLAAAGGEGKEIEAAVGELIAASQVYFYVNSLEWLRRSGRIGPAAARWGGALSIKPLLHVADGDIVALEKVRTSAKAIDRLVELAVHQASGREVEVAVQHLGEPERGAKVAAMLGARLAAPAPVRVREVGPVIGAHVGPGLLGIAVSPA